MSKPPLLSIDELSDQLKNILISGPLYKKFVYNSVNTAFADSRAATSPRFSHFPAQLKMYCDHDECNHETLWGCGPSDQTYYFAHGFGHIAYLCRNCGFNSAHYSVHWIEDQDGVATFCKVGQYPALSIEPPPILGKALGAEDSALYKKALINGNSGFGIGALAYFRRVIENKVNLLLDMVAEAAKLVSFETEELLRITEIKASHHVDTKIEYASKILPANLRPGGHNPLNKLYAVASAGIHGKSDDQCLDDFQAARFEFEYLFKNLTVTNEDAREYLERVSKPSK